jgi:hypothetical protein
MALSDYADPYADIPAGNTTIRVYGLNLASIGHLQQKHGEAFLNALTTFKGFFGSGDPKSVEYAIVALVCQMADLVADAIALGAREPGHADAASRLPLDVQIAAATQICLLTSSSGAFTSNAADLQKLLRSFGPPASSMAH